MIGRITLVLTFIVCATFALRGQDLHFTMFDRAPLWLNPAHTGNFEGTFRVGAVYRDQWRSFLGSNAFKTPLLYFDAPIIRGLGKYDWIGVGGSFVSDRAGMNRFGVSGGSLSGAYHLSLDKDRRTVITLGGQWGRFSRNIDLNTDARFGDELGAELIDNDPGFTSPDRNPLQGSGGGVGGNNMGQQRDYTDINAGLAVRTQLNENTTLNAGFGLFHIGEPQVAFLGGGSRDARKQPMRMGIHGNVQSRLNDKWSVRPTFFYQVIAGTDEIQIQTTAGYLVNPEKEVTLIFGAGYRMRDAAQVLLGVDIKDISVGLAYDVNLSDLTQATNSVGGFELAASYIGKIYKDPNVPPVIFCPRF
jgi:type IX secretion system PorP/SprF family membrane protein